MITDSAASPTLSEPLLVGRDPETLRLADLVNDVKRGIGRSLLYLGSAGVGKSRLLAGLRDGLRDEPALRVVRVSGMRSEAGLEYGAAQRLLTPFASLVDKIEEPQREALRAVFIGIPPASPPSRLAVSVGALDLLIAARRTKPYLFVVDDAHWFDDESLSLLGFLARRAPDCGLGFVIAGRDGHLNLAALDGLPGSHLAGLDAADSAVLLARAGNVAVGQAAAARISADAEGNPRALIELARRLTPDQLNGRSPLPVVLPTWPGLASEFLRQARALPTGTQALLVLVAAMCDGDRPSLWDAAALLRIPRDFARPAQRLGILSPDEHPAFTRPLLRAAAYASAEPMVRRAAHTALAAVAERNGDEDLAAWHRAAPTFAPDERLAAALEANAGRAGARGGPANRALFLSRAAELSPLKPAKERRLFEAARAYLDAGDGVLAGALLDRAAQSLDPETFAVETHRLRASIDVSLGRHSEARAELQAAIDHADCTGSEVSSTLLHDAFHSAMAAGRYATATDARAIAERMLAVRTPGEAAPGGPDAILDAFALRMTSGYERAAPLLQGALRSRHTDEGAPSEAPSSVLLTCLAADDLWDDRSRSRHLGRAASMYGRGEPADVRRIALAGLSVAGAWSGDIAGARRDYESAARLPGSHDASSAAVAEAELHIRALTGDEDRCRPAAAHYLRRAADQRCGLREMGARSALAILEIGLGNYSDAAEQCIRVMDNDLPGSGSRILPEVVEACVRTGQIPTALAALERLRARAAASGTPWALGLLDRSEALLAVDGAEASYLSAIARLSNTTVRFDQARAHLLYGEWLRRQKRRIDAQTQLRTAHDVFTAMDAAAFGHRAYRELLAAGYPPRDDHRPAGHGLTPQEAQVARFAAAGATNAEIAETMCLTISTIEYHLNKIFRKVGVSSRRRLAKALSGAVDARDDAHYPLPQRAG